MNKSIDREAERRNALENRAGSRLRRSPERLFRKRGIALVVVLSFIVIVSLILVAFVTAMRLEQTASASYSSSLRADETALGALTLVVADLQKEMDAGGAADLTFPGKPLYTNITSANIRPQRIGVSSSMTNLVRVSGDSSFTNSPGAVSGLRGSTNLSSTPSMNGRYVSAQRWAEVYLGDFTSQPVPGWIFISRMGATNGAGALFTGANAVNNPAPDNGNYIGARFAYAVYDVGGLLDISMAGYPTQSISVAAAQAIKGTLAGADLSVLGIDPEALTKWRNAKSASSGTNYLNYITNAAIRNGFKEVATGDTTFLSRQDLIKAAKMSVAGLSTNALPNLSTFSRERNAPSYFPRTPAGSTIDYGTQARTTTSTNVFIPLLRRDKAATIKSYQVDGASFTYEVEAGDPLVYFRFPLDRIRWLGSNGPQSGGTEESIQACFGLKWDPAANLWKYVGPSGSTEQSEIKTLAQVLADTPAREPNFFELLQAGILSGSLAKDGGAKDPFTTFHQRKSAFHVFRIGASIISQYESSSCPAVIEYDQSGAPWQACGMENLPYLNFVRYLWGYTSTPSSLEQYMTVSLWNPHQAVGSVTSRPRIRLRIKGSFGTSNGYYSGSNSFTVGSPPSVFAGEHGSMNGTIELSSTAGRGVNGFSEPNVPVGSDLTSTPGSAVNAWALMPAVSTTDGANYLGYRLPDFPISQSKTSTGGLAWSSLRLTLSNNVADLFNVWLEYLTPGGVWIPYNYGVGINDEATGMSGSWSMYSGSMGGAVGAKATPQKFDASNISNDQAPFWAISDPRSTRFNLAQVESVTKRQYWKASLWSADTMPALQTDGTPAKQVVPATFPQPPPYDQYFLAKFSRNNASATTKVVGYTDPDGVRRLADSGLYTSTPSTSSWEGDPYARSADRPVILNRPFYSVGELGYVARDYPWRTLDFFTDLSGDAGLLDLFTVGQSMDRVRHGCISLNSPNKLALAAVLKNTMADVIGGATVGDASAMAANITSLTQSAPLAGKDELVTKIASGLGGSSFGNTMEQNIKTRREVAVRALTDVGQTRTWNLLIDVVAQTGRYPQNASNLDQFVVEGERRYWLHVAIDRFTGEVLDRQMELVNP